MALKFLNKKGWHTGSLRNIENVWKAEQKHDAEQKKLEELRKQINEEREKSEFRQLQEAAGLVPRQERLDFLYESGLAVGKGSSEGFKALQEQPSGGASSSATESSSSKATVPGALFEDKPQSANDAWRKLHSDPLLLIRQREQEALARIKNNPIRMAMIRKSVESEKQQQDKKERKKKRNKIKHGKSKSKDADPSKSQSDLEYCSDDSDDRNRHDRPSERQRRGNADDKEDRNKDKKYEKVNHATEWHEKATEKHAMHEERRSGVPKSDSRKDLEPGNYYSRDRSGNRDDSTYERHGDRSKKSNDYYSSKSYSGSKNRSSFNEGKMSDASTANKHSATPDHALDARNKAIRPQNQQQNGGHNRRGVLPKMTEEEREARLREMQMDAELHEDQRWKRLKKASEADALEASQSALSRGKSFLDAAQKSVYGVENGGSASIEESVRRRAFYSQGRSAHETNAFRR